jgi:hypothetical protein
LSSPPNHVHQVKKSRKRVKGTRTKELPNLTNNTKAPSSKRSKSKKKRGRSRSPSSSISTIPDPDDAAVPDPDDDAAGSEVPDIGLPMKDTWETLYANLKDVPEVHLKEEKLLDSKAVEHVKKRQPTKLPSR